MADKVQINQAGVVTVYDPANKVQINQAGVTVVYSDQASASFVQVGQAGVAVVYLDRDTTVRRQFPIPNVKTRWQSQGGKRVFPVGD